VERLIAVVEEQAQVLMRAPAGQHAGDESPHSRTIGEESGAHQHLRLFLDHRDSGGST